MICWSKSAVLGRLGALSLVLAVAHSCGNQTDGSDLLPLTVNARGRGISTIPVIIAADQILFKKHGLDVTLLLPPPDNENGKNSQTLIENWWYRAKRRLGLVPADADINLFGGSPLMLRSIANTPAPHPINIGATDCIVRAHIITGKNSTIERLEDLSGMRLGASRTANTGFHFLLLAERMGWNPGRDIEFVNSETDSFDDLDAGIIDALIVYESTYSRAIDEGYPILFDTALWNEEVAGNSIAVDPEWLENPTNREAARRFLMAIAEAISLYHQDSTLALQIMEAWNGLRGAHAERIYDRGAWLPSKPFPCYGGYEKSMELYGTEEVQAMGIVALPGIENHGAEEFYDDSIMREIDATGFFDALYR